MSFSDTLFWFSVKTVESSVERPAASLQKRNLTETKEHVRPFQLKSPFVSLAALVFRLLVHIVKKEKTVMCGRETVSQNGPSKRLCLGSFVRLQVIVMSTQSMVEQQQ